jgi:hypothetical protein
MYEGTLEGTKVPSYFRTKVLSYESTKVLSYFRTVHVLYFRTFESTSGGSARRERARRGEEVARSRSAREAHIIYVDEVDCHETET